MSYLDEIEQQASARAKPLRLRDGLKVIEIRRQQQAAAAITLSDGRVVSSVCVRCPNTPCMRYQESDASLPGLVPDKTLDVCAVRAIHVSGEAPHPAIDSDVCVSCGVCVGRCPVGAVYFDAHGAAAIASSAELPAPFEETELARGDVPLTAEKLPVVTGSPIQVPSTEAVLRLHTRLRAVSRNAQALRPNVLVRNLLRAMGLHAESQRDGVQYNSCDVVAKVDDGHLLILEVSSRDDGTMDAPRDIAADTAMLVTRHGVSRSSLISGTCLLSIPPSRSEYWDVLKDFQTHFGLTISTIPLMGLVIAVWLEQRVDFTNLSAEPVDSSLLEVWSRVLSFNLRSAISPEVAAAFDRVAQRPS